MAKIIKWDFEVSRSDPEKDEVILSERGYKRFSEQDLNESLVKARQKLMVSRENLEQFKDWVSRKGWEDDLKTLETDIGVQEQFVKALEHALEPFYERKMEEGRRLVVQKKKSEKYDRLDKRRKREVMVKILNEVREELGYDDIHHPVILRLGKSFDEVK